MSARRIVMLGIDAEDSGTAVEILRALADRVEQGEIFEGFWSGRTAAACRKGNENACGETPFVGRFYAVGYDSEDMRPPVAFFAHEKDAEAYANGGVYENDNDRPSNDGVIVRADIVGSEWNSFEDDPIDDKTSAFGVREFL